MKLPFYSAYTFRLHLRTGFLDGIFFGIALLNEFVLYKGLNAPPWLLPWFVFLSFPLAQLLSAFFGGWMAGRAKAPFLVAAGLLRVALVAVAFVDHPAVEQLLGAPYAFTAVVAVCSLSAALAIPAANSIVQSNYHPSVRGKAFGLVTSVGALAAIGANVGAGWCLEADPTSYRWLYPLAGVAGLLSCLNLARIRVRRRDGGLDVAARPRAALVAAWGILRRDRPFRCYEQWFFLYGVAFLMMLVVVPVYVTDTMRASWEQIAYARGLIFMGLTVLLAGPFGPLLDRSTPARFSSAVFAGLALYPLTLALGPAEVWVLYLAFGFFGAAMAGNHLVWNLASIHFAGGRDSAAYQGVHVMLVGVRGLIAPALGYLVNLWAGPRWAFTLAALFLLAAAAGMRWGVPATPLPAPLPPPPEDLPGPMEEVHGGVEDLGR